MTKRGTVYLAIVSGAGSLETQQIGEDKAVNWKQLHPEALYQLQERRSLSHITTECSDLR